MRVVTAAVIVRDGRVLVTRRAPGERYAGRWEFPGGKVEPGESPEAGLARELFEELALEAQVCKHLLDVPLDSGHDPVVLRFYEACILSGIPSLRVHDRLDWAEITDLPGYDFLPADMAMVSMLMQDCLPLESI